MLDFSTLYVDVFFTQPVGIFADESCCLAAKFGMLILNLHLLTSLMFLQWKPHKMPYRNIKITTLLHRFLSFVSPSHYIL